MAITKAALRKRIERVSLQAGLCPKDGDRLWCANCQLSWDGTEAEWQELITLASRLPYGSAPGPTPYRCQICRDALWCDTCFRTEVERMPPKPIASPLSPEALERYSKLSAYLVLRDRSEGLPPIRLHWGDLEDAEGEVDAASKPPLEPPAVVSLETNNPPEPDIVSENTNDQPQADADEDDAELAALLAQLQRRLGR
jgi:hypothetical protein